MHPGIADVAIVVQRAGEVFRVQPDIADRQSGIDQAGQVGNVAVEQVDAEDAAIREATLVAQVESDRGLEVQVRVADRKSVVEGKSVSVRLDLVGRLIIKQKNNNTARYIT